MRIFARALLLPGGASPEESKRRLAEANPGSVVLAAKALLAQNERFVELLAAQTLQAESSGAMLANRREMDLLLRLAGTTQIARAIRDAGAVQGERFVLVVAGRRPVKLPSTLDGEELRRRELTDFELEKVEKAALLNARRT